MSTLSVNNMTTAINSNRNQVSTVTETDKLVTYDVENREKPIGYISKIKLQYYNY